MSLFWSCSCCNGSRQDQREKDEVHIVGAPNLVPGEDGWTDSIQ